MNQPKRKPAVAHASEPKRLRRPVDGGYARGDETRLRIVEAAIDLFGQYGFDGASTRDIAARAGVNAPALQYYFENKEGVLRACAEHIADDTCGAFGPVITHVTQVLASQAEIPALIDVYLDMLDTMADRMFAKSTNLNQRLFFAREQSGGEPDIVTEILTRRVRQPLHAVNAQLLARITGAAPDDPVNLVRILTLYGQLLTFHVAHRSSLALLGWKEMDAHKAELVKATVRAQTRTLLEHWAQERVTQPVTRQRAVASKTAAVASHTRASQAKPRVSAGGRSKRAE